MNKFNLDDSVQFSAFNRSHIGATAKSVLSITLQGILVYITLYAFGHELNISDSAVLS